MAVLAIGIELPLMMPADRLQHSHLSEDHRAAELRGARDEMSSAERHLRLFLSRILEGLGVPFAHHRSDRGFYR